MITQYDRNIGSGMYDNRVPLERVERTNLVHGGGCRHSSPSSAGYGKSTNELRTDFQVLHLEFPSRLS